MDVSGFSVSPALRWWADGLRQALPEPLSNLLFGPSGVLSLSIRDDRAVLELEALDGVHQLWDEAIERDPKSEAWRIVQSRAMRRATAVEVGETVIRLPRSQVLSTQIDLPARAALDLRKAIRADLDRFTPFRSEDVHFDAQITTVDNENDRIKVVLQVAQIADVEAAVELARSIGLRATRVTGRREPGGPSLNLLPAEQRFRPLRILPRMVKVLAVLFVCVVTLHAALLYWRKNEALEESQAHIRQLRTTAVAASEMEDRLADFQAAVSSVEDAKAKHSSALVAIATVTEALTDQSFLIGFEMEDDTVTLSGFSPDPTGMLIKLEENSRLANARFTAPTTRDARTGLNRFIVEVEIVEETE